MAFPAPRHTDFDATPWVEPLLADARNTVISQSWRNPQPGTTKDSLFTKTLNTPDTFRAFVVIDTPAETLTIVALGSGVNAHENVAHGGLVMTLMDEGLSACVREPNFTAYLNTTFKNLVPTPSVVVCRSRVVRRAGKKIWIEGTLEDGTGRVLAEAQALYIDPFYGKL